MKFMAYFLCICDFVTYTLKTESGLYEMIFIIYVAGILKSSPLLQIDFIVFILERNKEAYKRGSKIFQVLIQ